MVRILVTGATGTVGSQVVSALRAEDVEIRVLVRDAEKAAAILGTGVEPAVGDFDDSASLRRALDTVDGVFLTSADGPRKVAHETALIDAAKAAETPRIVKLSAIGAATGSPLGFSDWHGRIEEHLWHSGVPAVVLRASFFMSNLLAAAESVRHTGRLFAPAADARIAMIDPRDIGAAAATVLTGEGHDGQTLSLSGPEAITYERVAADLGAATGRPVVFVDVPGEAARAELVNSGAPEWLADNLVRLFGRLREGMMADATDTVRALTGCSPRPFADFARDHAAAFTADEQLPAPARTFSGT